MAPKKRTRRQGAARKPRATKKRVRILTSVRRWRVPASLDNLHGEVKTLRREVLNGVDRIARQIERFGQSLQKRARG